MLRKLTIPIVLFVLVLSTHSLAASSDPARPAVPAQLVSAIGGAPGVYSIDYMRPSTLLDPRVFPVDGQLGYWQWSDLNPVQGHYDWDAGGSKLLDAWIKKQVDAGLRPAIMISTYDGSTGNDIRSTPNWVIRIPGATLPVTLTNGLPHYIDYFHRGSARHLNGEFDLDTKWWTVSNPSAINVVKPAPADGYVSETPTRPDRPAKGPALKLGGANNVNATIAHDPEPVPAMPPSLDGQVNAYITARVNIVTSDPSPNDHLYLEVWDANDNLLSSSRIDVDNRAQAGKPASYWGVYKLDITPFALAKTIKVAFRVVTDAANPTTFYVDNVQVRVRHLIPKYWADPYLQAYKEFIAALGGRYKATPPGGDPRFDLAYVGMGTGVYGESQPTQDVNEWEYGTQFDHVVKNAGLDTTEKWQAFVNEVTATYAAAFGGTSTSSPAKPLLLQYAPTFISAQEKGYTADFAAARGVGLCYSRLIPEWTQIYKNDRSGGYDPIRLYWDKVPAAFEGVSGDLGCSPVLSYWAVLGAVAHHTDYLRLDPNLLQDANGLPTAHTEVVQWARQYLGKTVEDTPRVWTVLREHRNPSMLRCGYSYYLAPSASPSWPEYGNFSFWLTQDDTIAGGRTVAETNDKGADRRYAMDPATGAAYGDAGLGNCPAKSFSDIYKGNPPTCNPQPYNPSLPALAGQNPASYKDFYDAYDWTGGGKEAYVVRRTDQATGNPYMYFRIDDGYIGPARPASAVRFTVGYFDIGTDRWSVKYQSATGEKVAGTVTKGGTKAYKEVSFTVSDAKLANGLAGGADFYLDSRAPGGANDGDEWLHKVEVERVDDPVQSTDTPTPTTTSTATSTPSATLTPSPTSTTAATATATSTATGTPTVTPSPTFAGPWPSVSRTPPATPQGRVFLPVLLR